MEKIVEIPEGYEARIDGNKVIIEQKESEDERMRKEIIEYFKHYSGGDNISVRFRKWIAYLEKQKEQKQILFIPRFRVGDKVVSTKNPRLTYDILEVGCINELGNPDYKVEIFTDGKPGINSEPHNIHFIECSKMDEWGERIEPKPAEWTKEDEEWMGYFERLLEYGYNHDPRGFGRCCIAGKMWLKSFHPQPKQEWSEEDEKSIEKLDGFLSEVFCYGHVYVSQKDKEELQNWLKSLRHKPHWKPSEEQMKSLSTAYRLGKLGKTDMEVLQSLHNDLKKL